MGVFVSVCVCVCGMSVEKPKVGRKRRKKAAEVGSIGVELNLVGERPNSGSLELLVEVIRELSAVELQLRRTRSMPTISRPLPTISKAHTADRLLLSGLLGGQVVAESFHCRYANFRIGITNS